MQIRHQSSPRSSWQITPECFSITSNLISFNGLEFLFHRSPRVHNETVASVLIADCLLTLPEAVNPFARKRRLLNWRARACWVSKDKDLSAFEIWPCSGRPSTCSILKSWWLYFWGIVDTLFPAPQPQLRILFYFIFCLCFSVGVIGAIWRVVISFCHPMLGIFLLLYPVNGLNNVLNGNK